MSKKRKKSSERLVERLNNPNELDARVPADYEFRSLSPGHWAKAAGAWSWMITSEGGFCIGSPDTVAQCLKSPELNWGPHGTIYAE